MVVQAAGLAAIALCIVARRAGVGDVRRRGSRSNRDGHQPTRDLCAAAGADTRRPEHHPRPCPARLARWCGNTDRPRDDRGVPVGRRLSGGLPRVRGIAGSAALLAFRLPPGGEVELLEDDEPLKLVGALRLIAKAPGPRAALLLLTAQGLLIGCLDLLIVAIPDRTHGSLASAGWYGTALGAGAILGGTASVLLIGRRRLWPAAVASAVVSGGTVAALCATRSPVAAGAVFVAIGAAAAVMLVASRATLQRLTELRLVGHVFAAAEALESAMLLAGALLVPALVSAAGINGTCLAIAGILLVAAVVVLRPIATAEGHALGAFERVAALREVATLAHLGAAMLESLGRAALPHTFAAGSALMTQGDPGDVYQVIVNGHVDISQDGSVINHLGPGSGVGEIALLFPTPRTATVTATDEVNTLSLDRETFLLALTQQPPPTSVYALMHSRMTKPEPMPAAT